MRSPAPLLASVAAGFAAAACLAAPSSAAAQDQQTVVAHYGIFGTGYSASYRAFGYTPEGGDFTPLVGSDIVDTNILLDYTAGEGDDISAFHIGFAVPVEGAQSEFFGFDGDQFTEVSPGVYHYELNTDVYNGTIRDGSFGIEVYFLDDDGSPTGGAGSFSDDSGLNFTVAVPEPTTAALAGAGVLLLARRRRRRAQ